MWAYPTHMNHASTYFLEVLWRGGTKRKWIFEAPDPKNLAESTVGDPLVRVSV